MQQHVKINGVHFWWITKKSLIVTRQVTPICKLYWTKNSQEHSELHLPRNFHKENYDNIGEWYCVKPIMNPLHTWDLSHLRDGVYKHIEAIAFLQPNELQYGNAIEEDYADNFDEVLL